MTRGDISDSVIFSLADCSFGHQPVNNRTSHVTCYPSNHQGDNHGNANSSHSNTSSLNSSPSKCESGSDSPSKHSTPDSHSPESHSRHIFVRTCHGPVKEAWIITPPPCFTAGKKGADVGMTDLENLLIEHPSMSVYKRSGSEGEESNDSESSEEQEHLEVAKSKRSHVASRQAPHRARAVSARVQLMSQVEKIKMAQRVQTRQATRLLSKKNTERSNKVSHCDRHQARKNKQRQPSGRMNGRVPQRKRWCDTNFSPSNYFSLWMIF